MTACLALDLRRGSNLAHETWSAAESLDRSGKIALVNPEAGLGADGEEDPKHREDDDCLAAVDSTQEEDQRPERRLVLGDRESECLEGRNHIYDVVDRDAAARKTGQEAVEVGGAEHLRVLALAGKGGRLVGRRHAGWRTAARRVGREASTDLEGHLES